VGLVALVLLGRRLLPDAALTAVATAALLAAGGLLVLHPWGTPGYLARGALSQALCLTGLAVVWSALARGRGTATGRGRQRISGRSTNR